MLLLLATTTIVHASTQQPDKVIFEGHEYNLHQYPASPFLPMEHYFAKYPNKKPRVDFASLILHRGFIATYEIKDDLLTLNDIKMFPPSESPQKSAAMGFKSVKNLIFQENESTVLRPYTGILILPHGAMVNYWRGGYLSVYSHYLLLEVKEGKLTEKRKYDLVDYELFKGRQFREFKKTNAYQKQVESKSTWRDDQKSVDKWIRRNVVSYSTQFLVD